MSRARINPRPKLNPSPGSAVCPRCRAVKSVAKDFPTLKGRPRLDSCRQCRVARNDYERRKKRDGVITRGPLSISDPLAANYAALCQLLHIITPRGLLLRAVRPAPGRVQAGHLQAMPLEGGIGLWASFGTVWLFALLQSPQDADDYARELARRGFVLAGPDLNPPLNVKPSRALPWALCAGLLLDLLPARALFLKGESLPYVAGAYGLPLPLVEWIARLEEWPKWRRRLSIYRARRKRLGAGLDD